MMDESISKTVGNVDDEDHVTMMRLKIILIMKVLNLIRKWIRQPLLIIGNTLLGLGLVMMERKRQDVMVLTKNT